MAQDLIKDLQSIVSGEVANDPKTLDYYSRDWSLFQVMPKAVISPKNANDIKALVKYASNSKGKVSLTARAAGTDMSGGPLNDSVILDVTKHLNNLLEIAPEKNKEGSDGYAIVEPGMFYRDFEKETLKYGMIFPSYPASKSLCAIGGIVANNSGGEKSLTYGKTERYVEEVDMVLSDGEIYNFKSLTQNELNTKLALKNFEGELYRKTFNLVQKNHELLKKAHPKVSKNSTGYSLWNIWDPEKKIFDLTKLIVGSQGTLGIITKVKLNLVRPKDHSTLLIMFIDDKHFGDLGKIILKILEHNPESFESFDDHTLNIALRFFPDLLKTMGAGSLVSLGLQFIPEVWMAITGGTPKLILVAEFTGDSEEEIYKNANTAKKSIDSFGIRTRVAKNDREENKYWTIRRQSFKLLTDHSSGKRTLPFIDDVVVNPKNLPEFLPRLYEILSKYDLVFTVQGHIGDGNFHIIPLGDIGDETLKKTVPELSKKVFDLVFEYGGSISGEHNDGLVRTPYLRQMYGNEVYSLFEEIKRIFDPNNIFNPHKKVGEPPGYLTSHIDTDPHRAFAGEEKK